MYFYFIDGHVTSSIIELKASNGFGRAISISEAEYNFGVANPTASYSEIKAGKMNEVIATEPTEVEPSLEEIVAANADALDELIQHVYGSI